jgi:integrase
MFGASTSILLGRNPIAIHVGVITRTTERRLGIRAAPHDVRDAAATTWALTLPNRIYVARDLLGHSDLPPLTDITIAPPGASRLR